MNFLLNYLLISFPESFVTLLWGTTLFGYPFQKIKNRLIIIALISSFFSDFLWEMDIFADFRVILTLLLTFFLIKFVLKEKWVRSFFIFISAFASLLISEAIVVISVTQFYSLNLFLETFHLKFLLTLAYLTPLLIGTWIFRFKNWTILPFFAKKSYDRKIAFYWGLIFGSLFLQIFLIIYLNYAFYIEENQFLKEEIIFKISGFPLVSLSLIIANLSLVFFIVKLKNYHLKKEISLYEDSYHENIQNLIHTLKSERHDFINEIQTLYMLVKVKRYDEIDQYIQQLVQNIHSLNRVIQIKNVPVSALLHTKISQIESQDISIDIIAKTSDAFPSIKGYDLVKIISNILDNAIRAVSESKSPQPKIVFIWEKVGNEAIITITNNGPKIPEEIIPKIFQQGYSTKQSNGEHGYGLAIVKKTIEKYNGKITVSSHHDQTEFTIRIPL